MKITVYFMQEYCLWPISLEIGSLFLPSSQGHDFTGLYREKQSTFSKHSATEERKKKSVFTLGYLQNTAYDLFYRDALGKTVKQSCSKNIIKERQKQ